MPVSIWEDFGTRFGVDIFEFYGTAEGGLTLNPPGVGPVGSIGRPPPNLACAIIGTDGRSCRTGASGEICVRNSDGSPVAVAYYKNPQASARKNAGGWFHSGDIGHIDDQGWLYFEYRSGASIRRNGEFINPGFVEKVIAEISSVRDVFVYGVHTAGNAPGEKEVVAAVEFEGAFEAATIFAACRAALEANSVPRYLQRVEAIPKTASEKPQERLLLETFAPDAANVFTDSTIRA